MVCVSDFDPSAFLDDDEVVAEYLTAALEDDNPDVFLAAVGNVAKARGMSAVAERTGMPYDDLLAAAAKDVPVRRVGQPDDVASAVSFFCSEDASYVSGQVLYVAGGPRA